MKKIFGFSAIAATVFILAGCQTTAQSFNGKSGYQIIEQGNGHATLSYVLSGNSRNDQSKFQSACQQVLGNHQQYNVQVVSTSEIINPTHTAEFGRQIGKTNTKFGLSNTPNLYNNDIPGASAGLDAKPTTLRLIRFTCA